jgi:7-cyano-7-deazaguanine synthase
MKQAVLSLSGGMDSSSLLLHLLANGYEVTALGFDYGQKHKVELERATSLVEYLNANRLTHTDHVPGGFVQAFPVVRHQIIKLDGLSKLLNSALVEGGQDVPEGHYEQDNMKETVVPNRNKIFSSLIQAVALSVATKNIGDDCAVGEPVAIAMGIHAGDHVVYKDCRQEFRDVDFEAFKAGNWDADLVYHYTPYLEVNKFDILEDGQRSCDILGLDFNEVYKRTNTSYKPIFIKDLFDSEGEVIKWGRWYSDYKSAASVERIEAFIKLGRPDPVAYADETGPVTWEVAKAHVEKVLAEHNS